LIATFLWLLVVWLVVRTGCGLPAAIASGYAVWGVLIAILIFSGLLTVNR